MNRTKETLDLLKSAQDVNKGITTATGLVSYDLQGPAKNLYPVLTPLRNKLPRVPGDGGKGTNWKVISAVVGSGISSMPWIPEGNRSAAQSYAAVDKAALYRTMGEEDFLTFEAQSASKGFEDVKASAAVRLLQGTMIKEEKAILGGNASVQLGTPGNPSLAASAASATLPAATYSVIVAALTFEGQQVASLSNGVITQSAIVGMDGQTFTLNGGVSNKSAAVTQAVTLGQALLATVPPVMGAVAYAWFVGTAGNETLQAITQINSAVFNAPLTAGRQAATVLTGDFSTNSALAFDGFLSLGFNSSNSAYVLQMPTGVAGVGTPLTSGGRGNVVEIDNMLKGMWDQYRLGVTVIYCSSQELQNITNKVMSTASGTLLRYNSESNGSDQPYKIAANGVITAYYNPFMPEGGRMIPVKIHPNLPAGTIMGYCEELPSYYQNNNVANVAEMHMRRDYYQIDWPLTKRRFEMGVYAEGVLAHYMPQSIGIITNIANG